MERQKAEAVIEAILFTMGESVEISRLAEAVGEDVEVTREIIDGMRRKLDAEDRGIAIIELENAYQMCTKGEMYELLSACRYAFPISSPPSIRPLTAR